MSNAGNSKVEVFDPSGNHLTSIPNTSEPCGLAVDSRGTLFVSEQGSGDVVRYVPGEYPFSGTPTYGPPEAIDSSGNAEGIAVDTTLLFTNSKFVIGGDDSLYIAKGDHIDAYRNETQRIEVNATGGTFKLAFDGQTTAALPYNATHAEVQAALEALSTVGVGNVAVTTANFRDTDHLVTFTHALGLVNVPPIEVDTTNLTGGGVFHEETQGGKGLDEVQRIEVASTTTGGIFTLTFDGQITAPIDYNAKASKAEGAGSVEAALEALSNVAPGDISVTGGPGASKPFVVTFGGAYAKTNVPKIETSSSLTPNEVQKLTVNASAGTFTLTFSGQTTVQTTAPIAFNASAASVQSALEALSNIAPGDVTVTGGPGGASPYTVSFAGAYAGTNVSQLEPNQSALAGSATVETTTPGANVSASTTTQGWNGQIGEGNLTDATGVAAYTYRVSSEKTDRYVFAADAATDQVKIFGGPNLTSLKLRKTISGPKSGEEFGFGTAGAYLAVDPGNGTTDPGNGSPTTQKCENPVAKQACTAGHLLVYDEAHKVVDEFEANGEFLDQLSDPAFVDAKPTALAVDRSGGAGDGTIYVTAGAGPGAKLLAFGPLAAPSRPPRAELSHVLKTAKAVATDSYGDVYAAAGSLVHVYGPDGKEIKVGPEGKGIPIAEPPSVDLAVDSACNVYVLVNSGEGNREKEKAQYYTPSSSNCPPKDGTQYSGPVTVATGNSFLNPTLVIAIGINPVNDHIFVIGYGGNQILELGSAAEGSPIRNYCFACALSHSGATDVAVDGANGNVYISHSNGGFEIIDPMDPQAVDDEEVVARITGAGSPNGTFVGSPGQLAVDQSNGHVLAADNSRGAAEEYDASGAFVTRFGEFSKEGIYPSGIAIDNSCALHDPPLTKAACEAFDPSNGNVYVALDESTPNTPDLWAFGPLAYGERPKAVTGIADGIAIGKATLNGTVDPRDFELEECAFEWGETEEPYEHTGQCAETPSQIGHGTGPVPVHLDITSGLDPETTRYHFRLVARNKYGKSTGEDGLFGPPVLTIQSALPVLYDEATLRAEVDPSGLATKYRFEYVTREHFEAEGFEDPQSTPEAELPPGDGPVAVKAPLTGLAEGAEYHFRIVAENEAKTVPGSDQTFETLERLGSGPCPNVEYRSGLSAKLPECRAYELITPAETRGTIPRAEGSGSAGETFNNWLVTPRGEGAGESLAYFTSTTLPGFEGTGQSDGYHAQRAPGPHPEAGWSNHLFSPSFAQQGGERSQQHGTAADQRYGFFDVSGQGALEHGKYLRTPSGLEPIGKGSRGTDMEAQGRFLSPGGAHVVFFSEKHLEPDAAPQGTVSVYDRVAGASSAEVVSVKPGGSAFGAEEDATYLGATEDGSAILFKVGGTLYLRREGTTVEIAAAPNFFAGISEDGQRVFYAGATLGPNNAQPADLFACDAEAGPCAGPGAQAATEIAPESIFLNVSADGSHVLFASKEALTGTEENEAGEKAEAGEYNLYLWDGAATRFLAILDPEDFESFGGNGFMNLSRWAESVSAGVGIGRSDSPTRSTHDGEVFVFQSHAQLTKYDSTGPCGPKGETALCGEIYRYVPAAAPGERLLCVSCDPTGAPASADAQLLVHSGVAGVIQNSTLVPNLTDDGSAVFFQSPDRLLPEDANEAQDVYEWKARGSGCERPGGCLALISSGQGEAPSYLYGMSADGHDVFFETPEKLIGADVPGSPSIYDARVEGGIPDPPVPAPCQGDACQGQGSISPSLPTPASTGLGDGNVERRPSRPCAKGKRRVTRKGKPRCIAKRHKHKRSARRAGHNGRPRR